MYYPCVSAIIVDWFRIIKNLCKWYWMCRLILHFFMNHHFSKLAGLNDEHVARDHASRHRSKLTRVFHSNSCPTARLSTLPDLTFPHDNQLSSIRPPQCQARINGPLMTIALKKRKMRKTSLFDFPLTTPVRIHHTNHSSVLEISKPKRCCTFCNPRLLLHAFRPRERCRRHGHRLQAEVQKEGEPVSSSHGSRVF